MSEDKQEKLREQLIKEYLEGKHPPEALVDYEEFKRAIDRRLLEHKAEVSRKQNRVIRISLVMGIFFLLVTLVLVYLIVERKTGNFQVVASAQGIRKIQLGGATIHLNTDSELRFSGDSLNPGSEIYLDKGEIFVDNPGGDALEIITKESFVRIFNGTVNVMSRQEYERITATGSDLYVKHGDSAFMLPLNSEYRDLDGQKSVHSVPNPAGPGSWRNGYIFLDNEKLPFAFEELQRSYRIKIEADVKSDILVSGLFRLSIDPIEVLRTILPPDYTVTSTGERTYRVTKHADL